VELRSGDLRLIRLIAKLKELKMEVSRVIDNEDVRRNRKVKSGLILLSGLLNDVMLWRNFDFLPFLRKGIPTGTVLMQHGYLRRVPDTTGLHHPKQTNRLWRLCPAS
jgi:hypothetical protein